MVYDNFLIEGRVITKELGFDISVFEECPDVLADPSFIVVDFPTDKTGDK